MTDDFDHELAFIHRMAGRMTTRTAPWEHGTALFHDELQRVWYLNFLRVERQDVPLDADALAREAEVVQGEAGLDHCKITVDDPRGAQLEQPLRALGWRVERDFVMAHRGEVPVAPAEDAVVEVTAADLLPVWEQGIREAPLGRDPETVRQLVAAQLLREQATSVRYFAGQAEGRLVSESSLFTDGSTAQVESVQTLEAFRGRGLARATVSRAVTEARIGGCERVFLLADAEDWAKELYRKIGFEPIGQTWDFVREPTSARRERTSPESHDS
jgi:GNAT superfamily N-acetyltransferase